MASDSPGKAWIALNSPIWALGTAFVILLVIAVSGSSSSHGPYPWEPDPSSGDPWETGGKPLFSGSPFEIDDVSLGQNLIPYADLQGRFTVLHPSSLILVPSSTTYIMASGYDSSSGIYMEVSGSTSPNIVVAEGLAAQFEPIISSRRPGYRRLSTRSAPLGGKIRSVEIVATYTNMQRGGAMTKSIMRFGGWGTNGYWIILEAPLASFDGYEDLFETIFGSLQTP
ncbi:MAG: hypothetical protein JXP34_07690 [Planctomycetes bacterium]|nr:hypothetical protein [Planctomycetota bacterium]